MSGNKHRGRWSWRLAGLGGAVALAAVFVWSISQTPPTLADEPPTPMAPDAHVVTRDHNPIHAGRYLVLIGGCNDCHTPGWNESGGKIPESNWLTGVPLGWRGPWGTTYASNLRLIAQTLTEDGWVAMLHTRNARPPMPWSSVNAMSENDQRAIYQFLRELGPKGNAMPPVVPPGTDPKGPYLNLQPVLPK